MMTLPDRLRALDDALFDRVFQPIVDLAAPWDVKARHLSAACYIAAGAVSFSRHPDVSLALRLIVPTMTAYSAYRTLYFRPTGLTRSAYDIRVAGLILSLGLSLLPPSLSFALFCLFMDSAFYFRDCQDKPRSAASGANSSARSRRWRGRRSQSQWVSGHDGAAGRVVRRAARVFRVAVCCQCGRRVMGCFVEGCAKHIFCKGYCRSHYRRFLRHGDPLSGQPSKGACLEFLEKAKEYFGDECVIWPYASDPRPRITMSLAPDHVVRRPRYVCRIICEHAYGPPPSDDMDAAHSCGNGHLGCITRRHLRWATRKENIEDSRMHGSMVCGERHPSSKLTDCAVIFIRNNSLSMSKTALARKFGVHVSLITNVIRGKAWDHVQDNRAGALT